MISNFLLCLTIFIISAIFSWILAKEAKMEAGIWFLLTIVMTVCGVILVMGFLYGPFPGIPSGPGV